MLLLCIFPRVTSKLVLRSDILPKYMTKQYGTNLKCAKSYTVSKTASWIQSQNGSQVLNMSICDDIPLHLVNARAITTCFSVSSSRNVVTTQNNLCNTVLRPQTRLGYKPQTVGDFDMLYKLTQEKFKSKKLPKDVNPCGVFANNELDLEEVDVYGFDYDYTLACYKPCLHDLLYNLGRDRLIKKFKGTVKQLQDLTGWRGHNVLYFGDHPYSDLADVTLEHGWRTGAIINELTHEIETLNNVNFKRNANWLQMLTQLIEEIQDYECEPAQICLEKWQSERDMLRNQTKMVFNKQFGSVFRTYHNPTYFSRRLFRFADIYTSDITNLANYSVSHTFYPRRGVMPHEYISYFM
uniref:5'-nucleotidase domain-containing protein 3 n=1 Tax=Bactrocera dorsalis TaxID=27457 RepID=A0A034VLV6_BACDO